mmetsp:Transcript_78495/g.217968  ORF Transcript_78495/g.217968 Transcript_78495/m.217968 type:complete len:80 (+) Transcript_78495:437-676(+)
MALGASYPWTARACANQRSQNSLGTNFNDMAPRLENDVQRVIAPSFPTIPLEQDDGAHDQGGCERGRLGLAPKGASEPK